MKRQSLRQQHREQAQERRLEQVKVREWIENGRQAEALRAELFDLLGTTDDDCRQNHDAIQVKMTEFVERLEKAYVMSHEPQFKVWAEMARFFLAELP